MAAGNLTRSLELIFGHEGGFTADRRDRGNWTTGKVGSGQLKGTKYGISAMSYPKEDIRNLTLARATEIYRRDFAAKVRFDELPSGVDHAVLDFAINSGPSRAAKYLQQVLGVAPDGAIGPVTLAAAAKSDARSVIRRLCDARLKFMRGLDDLWPTYGRGWTTRVERVELESLEMVGKAQPAPAPSAAKPAESAPATPETKDGSPVGKIVFAIVFLAAVAAVAAKALGVF